MLRSIDLSRAGMLRQGQYLDVTANNIAGANTPGFKAVRAALESGDVAPAGSADEVTSSGTPALSAHIGFNRLFTQGPLRLTGRPADMAISGDGFFTVRLPDGADAFTRNGGFRVSDSGRLTDDDGNVVQPGITLPPGTRSVQVGAGGSVRAVLQDGTTTDAGTLRLARFANPGGLLAGADGRFTATAASGPAIEGAPGQGGLGGIHTGMLEDANTDLGEQLTNLIAAQRAYQLNSSAFRTADEMLSMASQISGNA